MLGATLSLSAQKEATLTVQADKGTDIIPKEIYGQFAEHLGSCIYGGACLLCYCSDGDSFDYREHFRPVSGYLDCSAPCGFSGRFDNHDDRICHCGF